MKIDSKPFQLESELLNIDEMLANNSVDMDMPSSLIRSFFLLAGQ